MPAYLISISDPDNEHSDLEGMGRYAEAVRPLVESYGGVYLVRHQEAQRLEGEWNPPYIVLIQFPSMERLRAFYESDAYQPWLQLRQRSGPCDIVVTEDTTL